MIKIFKYGEVDNSALFARTDASANVEDAVAGILSDVRENGDEALYRYCEKFDGVRLTSLEVTQAEIDAALT